jgi:hypothetical protein
MMQVDDPLSSLKNAFQRLFNTNDGQEVLEHLTAKFHDVRIYMPGGLEGQRETERRAARKEVMEYIYLMMANPKATIEDRDER